MSALNDYIKGRGGEPSRRELYRLIESHEWFTTARRARMLVTGESDPALVLPLLFWPTVAPVFAPPVLAPRSMDGAGGDATHADAGGAVGSDPVDNANALIDRFIERGAGRIDPAVEAHQASVDIDIDPEMVTVELAEIYRSQGLMAEAEKIYRMLNLRD
jgi:hypothetical protein